MTDTTVHHSIVVGVDGSESALRATRWAAREAARRGVPLKLVHTCYLPPVNPRSPVPLPRGYRDALLDYGEDWLGQAKAAAEGAAEGVQVDTEVVVGPSAAELIEQSKTARMIVLGSRGLGGFSSLLIGSVAVAVTAHAECPVVVVRGHEHEDDTPAADAPVLVGVDGSEAGDAALGFAFDAAATLVVPLIAVHVWNGGTIESGWPTPSMVHSYEELEADEERLLAEGLAGWGEKYPDVDVHRRVRRGHLARELLREASYGLGAPHHPPAQLIVVGARGRGALAGLALGSVSQAVLHHAKCVVAVVRGIGG